MSKKSFLTSVLVCAAVAAACCTGGGIGALASGSEPVSGTWMHGGATGEGETNAFSYCAYYGNFDAKSGYTKLSKGGDGSGTNEFGGWYWRAAGENESFLKLTMHENVALTVDLYDPPVTPEEGVSTEMKIRYVIEDTEGNRADIRRIGKSEFLTKRDYSGTVKTDDYFYNIDNALNLPKDYSFYIVWEDIGNSNCSTMFRVNATSENYHDAGGFINIAKTALSESIDDCYKTDNSAATAYKNKLKTKITSSDSVANAYSVYLTGKDALANSNYSVQRPQTVLQAALNGGDAVGTALFDYQYLYGTMSAEDGLNVYTNIWKSDGITATSGEALLWQGGEWNNSYSCVGNWTWRMNAVNSDTVMKITAKADIKFTVSCNGSQFFGNETNWQLNYILESGDTRITVKSVASSTDNSPCTDMSHDITVDISEGNSLYIDFRCLLTGGEDSINVVTWSPVFTANLLNYTGVDKTLFEYEEQDANGKDYLDKAVAAQEVKANQALGGYSEDDYLPDYWEAMVQLVSKAKKDINDLAVKDEAYYSSSTVAEVEKFYTDFETAANAVVATLKEQLSQVLDKEGVDNVDPDEYRADVRKKVTALQATYSEADYYPSAWLLVSAKFNEANTQLDNATSPLVMEAILSQLKQSVAEFETKAATDAVKEEVLSLVNQWKNGLNEDDYRTDIWEEIETYYDSTVKALKAAETSEAAESIKTDFLAGKNNFFTKAQIETELFSAHNEMVSTQGGIIKATSGPSGVIRTHYDYEYLYGNFAKREEKRFSAYYEEHGVIMVIGIVASGASNESNFVRRWDWRASGRYDTFLRFDMKEQVEMTIGVAEEVNMGAVSNVTISYVVENEEGYRSVIFESKKTDITQNNYEKTVVLHTGWKLYVVCNYNAALTEHSTFNYQPAFTSNITDKTNQELVSKFTQMKAVAALKEEKKTALDIVVAGLDEQDYSISNWSKITDIVETAVADMQDLLSEEEIESVYRNAVAEIGAVKTISQEQAELEAYKKERTDELASLANKENYSAENWKQVEEIVSAAKNKISSSESRAAVDRAFNEAKNKIAKIEQKTSGCGGCGSFVSAGTMALVTATLGLTFVVVKKRK